jgi:putative transposase
MPRRTSPLSCGEIYHVFNRGSEKRDIFLQPRDYERFKKTLYYYQFLGKKPKFSFFNKSQLDFSIPITDKRYVEIIGYCLMPNHFHLLLNQLEENGITKFMQQLCNSHAKYFNTKYNRVGPLWQNRFKVVRIENDEQLVHVSRYIHLNPIVSKISRSLNKYSWSSYHEFLISPIICNPEIVLGLFKDRMDYEKFVVAQIDLAKELEILKHHQLDDIYDSTPGV